MSKTLSISKTDVIAFHHNISTNQKFVNIVDTLDFQWIFWDVFPTYSKQSDFIPFVQTVSLTGAKHRVSLIDHINLTNKANRIFQKTIIHTLVLSQPTPPIRDNIKFIETIIANNTLPITDTLFLLDTLTYTRNLHIYINDNLIFRNYSHGYKIPFIGRVSDQIYVDPLVINPRSEVTFKQADGNVFGLFRLSIGNEYRTQYNHIQKETRGKTLIIAGNDTYPYVKSVKSLHMMFEYLKLQEGMSFLNFLNNNLGQPITLQDHESIIFNGIITTSDLKLTQQDKNNFSLEFDFEILP